MFNIVTLLLILAACGPLIYLLALRLPHVFMMLTFLLTPFQQALIGEDSPVVLGVVDIIAALLILPLWFKFLKNQKLAIGAVSWPVILFLGLATLSTFVAGMSVGGVVSLVRMLMNTLLPVLIFANLATSWATYHKCYMAFLVACNILSVCVLFAFVSGGIQASMFTLGLHKNFIGPLLGAGVCVSVVCLLTESPSGRKRVWLIATLIFASIGLLFSLSRGGWLATALGMSLAVCLTRNRIAILATLVLGLGTMAIAWQFLPSEYADYASNVSTQAHTAQTRFEAMGLIMDAFQTSPIIGVGVELRKQVEPHDVLVLTAGETGVLGVIGFCVMFAVAFWTILSARNRVKSDPIANSILMMAAVVQCVALTDGIMDVYWRRGIGFMGWAGVGIAVKVIASTQSPPLRRLALIKPRYSIRRQEIEA